MAKNRIYSVLTSLPPLMLMIGLFFYYRAEQVQLAGPPILDEEIAIEGGYEGTSSLKSLGDDQLFFWVDTGTRSRGIRIDASQMHAITTLDAPLQVGEALLVHAAPRVAGSKTYWLLSVDRDGKPVF